MTPFVFLDVISETITRRVTFTNALTPFFPFYATWIMINHYFHNNKSIHLTLSILLLNDEPKKIPTENITQFPLHHFHHFHFETSVVSSKRERKKQQFPWKISISFVWKCEYKEVKIDSSILCKRPETLGIIIKIEVLLMVTK